jgi:RNA polymerase sigma factor (sigma-70 family)
MATSGNADLLARAATGDAGSWDAIVDRYARLVWAVARGFRLGEADAADVAQATWLRLVENLDRIRDPERLGPWLATTARREALAVLRRAGPRAVAVDDLDTVAAADEPAEQRILRDERDVQLWRAFGSLPGRCQKLLRLLLADPAPSYAEASAALDLPVGSIGPTRARCLDTLRRRLPR